jgi:hypothetical protein
LATLARVIHAGFVKLGPKTGAAWLGGTVEVAHD